MAGLLWRVMIIGVINSIPVKTDSCNPGFYSPVEIEPFENIYAALGAPIQLVCALKETEVEQHNSTHLSFEVLPNPSNVLIEAFNSSAISLIIDELTILNPNWRYNVYCKLNDLRVCLKSISVGRPPEYVTNFNCISYNLEYMECTWDRFINSPSIDFNTIFSLVYQYDASISPTCTVENDSKCIIEGKYYAPMYQNYTFTMTISNILGSLTQPLGTIDTWAYMIPAPMEKFNSSSIGKNSVCTSWTIHWSLLIFDPGLVYRMNYNISAPWSDLSAHDVDTSSIEANELCIDLPYANTEYLISLSARSSLANASNELLWSSPTKLRITTLPDRPCSPPNASLGSFSVVSDAGARHVTIYWSPIEPKCENGPMPRYFIQQFDAHGLELSSINVTSLNATSHQFDYLQNSESYTFRIGTCNELGCSDDWIDIFLPKVAAMPNAPRDVTKIHYGSSNYEIQWNHPSTRKQAISSLHIYSKDYVMEQSITSYTVFWCHSIHDIPMNCRGNLNWLLVPIEQTAVNISVPDEKKNYQFAVQSNQGDYSSGMVLPGCVVYAYGNGSQVETSRAVGVTNTSMTIEWSLPCSKQYGIVTGYKIYYCTVDGEEDFCDEDIACKGKEMLVNATAGETSKRIEDLKPFTWYKWSISVLTRFGEGDRSDSQCIQTREGVPSIPQALKIVDISNHSISFEWGPPEYFNGNSPNYKVSINDSVIRTNKTTAVVDEHILSYKNYVISIQACHDLEIPLCSDPCESVSVVTRIGVPSEPVGVKKTEREDPWDVIITWSPPRDKAGPNNTYNIKLEYPFNPVLYYNILESKWEGKISSTNCPGGSNYSVQIQAVNLNENNELLLGNWTDPEVYRCPSPGMNLGSVLAITLIAATLVVAIFAGINFWKRRRQILSKTTITLPWETSNGEDIKGKGTNEAQKSSSAEDPRKGYHRLQSDTTGSSLAASRHDSERSSQRNSSSSSNEIDSEFDSAPSSADSSFDEEKNPPSLISATHQNKGIQIAKMGSLACVSGTGTFDHNKLEDDSNGLGNTSPYVQIGDLNESIKRNTDDKPDARQSCETTVNSKLVAAEKTVNGSNNFGYLMLCELPKSDSLTSVETITPPSSNGYVVLGQKGAFETATSNMEQETNESSEKQTQVRNSMGPNDLLWAQHGLLKNLQSSDSSSGKAKELTFHITPTATKSHFKDEAHCNNSTSNPHYVQSLTSYGDEKEYMV